MSGTQPLFLGLDLSTQQLKGIVISENSIVVHEACVHYDKDLPQYGTTNGAILGPGDGEVTSPVQMWVDALDLLMSRMKDSGVDLSKIRAISGAGQQHGSVYWSREAESLLASLDPSRSLSVQLCPNGFSRLRSPIWQDSSTSEECAVLEKTVGGAQALADLTGSRAYERFTGSQILKLYRSEPEVYAETARISLVSSFVPSLFLGRIAEIEVSDASGMNLTDVFSGKWNDQLLIASGGPELKGKLGPEPVPGGEVLGSISRWWVERWGFSPECLIAPFTGDNPATVVALSAPGDALLSLGTSTTLLLSVPPTDTLPARFTTSHLLSHPTNLDAKIAMLCYKNGGLARDQVRDEFASKDWDRFNELVENSQPGNDGYLGFYFPLPEIIPPNVQGQLYFHNGNVVEELEPSRHPRAILESQLLSILSRVEAILSEHAPPLNRLILSGGASSNPAIQQLAADLFSMDAFVCETAQGAGMGGALLGKYSWWKKRNPGGTFEQMTGNAGIGLRRVASPRQDVSSVYQSLVPVYRRCEEAILQKLSTI